MQEDEARKYTENSRMVAIQAQLTERALELLVSADDGLVWGINQCLGQLATSSSSWLEAFCCGMQH